IDTVQAPLGNCPPRGNTFSVAEVSRCTASGANERSFVGLGKIAARCDEKRSAAHRRVDYPKLQDAFWRGLLNERPERAANQVMGNRLRRVKGSGRFPSARTTNKRDRSCKRFFRRATALFDARLVVKQRLVDGAELFDTEVSVRDPLAPAAIWRRPRGNGEN